MTASRRRTQSSGRQTQQRRRKGFARRCSSGAGSGCPGLPRRVVRDDCAGNGNCKRHGKTTALNRPSISASVVSGTDRGTTRFRRRIYSADAETEGKTLPPAQPAQTGRAGGSLQSGTLRLTFAGRMTRAGAAIRKQAGSTDALADPATRHRAQGIETRWRFLDRGVEPLAILAAQRAAFGGRQHRVVAGAVGERDGIETEPRRVRKFEYGEPAVRVIGDGDSARDAEDNASSIRLSALSMPSVFASSSASSVV